MSGRVKFPRRWDVVTQISYLQRKIIISSILYYELSTSPMRDQEFDEMCRQLIELQQNNLQSAKNSQYWYIFSDFQGETGYYLYYNLSERDNKYLMKLAHIFGERFMSGEVLKPVKHNRKTTGKRGKLF